jgi:hypothetical protein
MAAPASTYVEVYNPAGIREDGAYIDKLLTQIIKDTGMRGPQLAGAFPAGRTERLKVRQDAPAEINELFYRRGWTDGLPIVIPTVDRVRRMLRGTDFGPETLVALLDPMQGQATVEKIAVNAVMAGCKPEYMPVLIAAVEALANPAAGLKGLATTTSPDAPLLILTGPIIRELDLNAGTNSMGRGRQANAAIGRALQLIINNLGGSWPGVTDMSTLGNPAEYSWVVAENAALNPWTSLNADLGLPQSASVATVFGAEGIRGIIAGGRSSEDWLKLVAAHAEGLAAQRPHWPMVLLIIASDTAAQLKRDGWDKDSIRAAILKFCNAHHPEEGTGPRSAAQPSAPRFSIDHFLILVAGGTGEKSMLIPGWLGASGPVSKPIRVPERGNAIRENPRRLGLRIALPDTIHITYRREC